MLLSRRGVMYGAALLLMCAWLVSVSGLGACTVWSGHGKMPASVVWYVSAQFVIAAGYALNAFTLLRMRLKGLPRWALQALAVYHTTFLLCAATHASRGLVRPVTYCWSDVVLLWGAAAASIVLAAFTWHIAPAFGLLVKTIRDLEQARSLLQPVEPQPADPVHS